MVFTGSDTVERLRVEINGDGDGLVSELTSVEGSLASMADAAGVAGGAIAAVSAVMAGEAVDSARKWEAALADVERVTSEATADELHDSLLELGSDLAIPTRQLSGIAEAAGRLGVEGSESIEKFAETVGMISVSTDLAADQAASDFARLANAMNVPIEEIENMSSAVNTLSNDTASSASEIVGSMSRAAPAAGALGAKFEDVAAMAATLVASGMQVERSGTRLNEVFSRLSERSAEVAQATGMTASEFQRLVEDDPTQALFKYLEHLRSIESTTQQVTEANELFGRSGGKAVLALATNFDSLERSVQSSEQAYREATSVQEEYAAQADTLNAELQELQNGAFEFAVTTGDQMLPAVKATVGGLGDLTDQLNDANNATDGLLGQVGLTSVFFTSAGGAIARFVSGPLGLAVTAAQLAAISYQTNFADIQTTVDTSLARATELTESHLSEMNDITERELAKNNSIWAEAMEKGEGVVDVGVQSISGLVITQLDAMLSANRLSLSVFTADWDNALDTVQGFTVRTFVGLLDSVSNIGGDMGDEFVSAYLDSLNKGLEAIESFVKENRDVLNIVSAATGTNVTISEDFAMEKLSLPGEDNDPFSVPQYRPETAQSSSTTTNSDSPAANQYAQTTSQGAAAQYAQWLSNPAAGGMSSMPTAEFTPAIRRALESGVPGYESDPAKIEEVSMKMTPELFRALGNQQGGVTAARAGLSEEEFARVSNLVYGSGFTSGTGSGSRTPSLGGSTPAVASSMQQHVSSFGDHVEAFKRAVQDLQGTEWRVTASDEFEIQQRQIAREELRQDADRFRRGAGP
ncbi:phage tail tape measure protein [Haloferax namakaokahaiae]|uniref:Phage tail tape measure protein n=1 Tax=Haloferax namakaokahaiae TaxID=1748331 RepID=A0ABD5ZC41_9EURY